MLESHIEKEDDNLYHCDECEFTCDEKDPLKNHYKTKHKESEADKRQNEISKPKSDAVDRGESHTLIFNSCIYDKVLVFKEVDIIDILLNYFYILYLN